MRKKYKKSLKAEKRIIKFRVWHKVLKQMYPILFMPIWDEAFLKYIKEKGGSEIIVHLLEPNKTVLTCNATDIIPMQFTGLYDIKQREIYEGDIIRWYPNRPKNHFDYTVSWVQSCFFLGNWYENNFPDTQKYCKIIGNIYELDEGGK